MNMLMTFQFKGQRTYVHGSDFYNTVSSMLNTDEFINDISFRHVTNKNCFLKQEPEEGDLIAGVVKTNQRTFKIVEGPSQAEGRYEFDEEGLVNSARVNSSVITMQMAQKYTLIENIIALTKKLNYALDPDVKGKWLFGQLKLEKMFPSASENIQIESTRRIPNRFSENSITIDNQYFGTIIFIVGKP